VPKKVKVYQPIGEAYIMSNNNNYGCLSFVLDILLTLITGGLWLIWIFVREMRRR
jgi:hypothetical protein